MKWHCSFTTCMKKLLGVVFLAAFVALLAWLTGGKKNHSNIDPVTETTTVTTTTDDITVVIPTNSTTVSFSR